MNGMEHLARILISIGIFIVIAGIILYFFAKIGGSGFRLPGDIFIQKERFTFYFPIASCIIISVILTIIFNIIGRR